MSTTVTRPVLLALGFAGAFAVLTALVATGVTQGLDTRAVQELRPGDAWGPAQVRYSPWMSRLEPERMFLLLALTSVGATAWRRSWWPVAYAAVLAGGAVSLTVVAKVALHRADPHGYVTGSGGSYPSGHTVALLVCLAGCLLVVWPRVQWWLWSPVAGAVGLLAVGLLVSAAHWPTDVLGGALLALALVTAMSAVPLRRWACGSGSGSVTSAVRACPPSGEVS